MKTEANNTANVISQEGNGASQRIQEAIRAAEQEYDKFINSIKTVQISCNLKNGDNEVISVREQDICYKQVDKKIPLSYIIVIKENKLN